jgi:beta-lysine N6-acetyltransferase
VLSYEATNYKSMFKRLRYLASANHFDKIFVKARADDFQVFLSYGYMMEGVLRYFFSGEDAYVLSRFSSKRRVHSSALLDESRLIEKIIYHSEKAPERIADPTVTIRPAGQADIPALVTIYRSVFESYPSPLTNPDYIKSTMERNMLYRIAMQDGVALAAASAEMDEKNRNAEMTDCATTPAAQSKGLMQAILIGLEEDVRARGIITAYTLARGLSTGMNRVFFRLGYEYSGRLVNNCDIFGDFEDMNIWVKRLPTEGSQSGVSDGES